MSEDRKKNKPWWSTEVIRILEPEYPTFEDEKLMDNNIITKVISGYVKASRLNENGEIVHSRIVGPGEGLCSPFIYQLGRLTKSVELVALRKDDYPIDSDAIQKLLSNQIQASYKYISILSLKSLDVRFVELLVNLMESYGIKSDNRIKLPFQLTDKSVGEIIGAWRENATKIKKIALKTSNGVVKLKKSVLCFFN